MKADRGAMPGPVISLTKAALCRLCLLVGAVLLIAGAHGHAGNGVYVRHVLDGDTVVLSSGRTLRLWAVDAPELAHDGEPAQYFAEEARQELGELLSGQDLELVPAPDQRDHYGRMLGALRLADGRLVNIELVRRGCAFYYPHPKEGFWLAQELLAAQREAMAADRGFWPGLEARLQELGPVVGNQRSLRFFSQGCRDVERIARRNRMPFSDAMAAFYHGLAPARHCGVWPPAY